VEFLAVVCLMVLLTPGIASASSTAAPGQAPDAASQLPAPRDKIQFAPAEPIKSIAGMSSSYIPLDSWMYPAVMRLYGMGYVDTVFLGLRPWTRLSVAHMLDQSANDITSSNNDEAIETYSALEKELAPDMRAPRNQKFGRAGLDSVYERIMGVSGSPTPAALTITPA
jgi:hypothetical protein